MFAFGDIVTGLEEDGSEYFSNGYEVLMGGLAIYGREGILGLAELEGEFVGRHGDGGDKESWRTFRRRRRMVRTVAGSSAEATAM